MICKLPASLEDKAKSSKGKFHNRYENNTVVRRRNRNRIGFIRNKDVKLYSVCDGILMYVYIQSSNTWNITEKNFLLDILFFLRWKFLCVATCSGQNMDREIEYLLKDFGRCDLAEKLPVIKVNIGQK